MDRHKIQVYVDAALYETLVTAAKTENLSVSRYAERLLAEKSTGPIAPTSIESLLETVRKLILSAARSLLRSPPLIIG